MEISHYKECVGGFNNNIWSVVNIYLSWNDDSKLVLLSTNSNTHSTVDLLHVVCVFQVDLRELDCLLLCWWWWCSSSSLCYCNRSWSRIWLFFITVLWLHDVVSRWTVMCYIFKHNKLWSNAFLIYFATSDLLVYVSCFGFVQISELNNWNINLHDFYFANQVNSSVSPTESKFAI